jgi:L-amino acid N-acyltransferase YncA
MVCIICQTLRYDVGELQFPHQRNKSHIPRVTILGVSMTDTNNSAGQIITVREAVADDMTAIALIYGYEVENGVASFEEVPPTADELNSRREGVVGLGLPYLVAKIDGRIAGYCYASTYRPRAAYRYTLENTVYVAREARGRGVASTLLTELIKRCEMADRRQMIAVIAVSDTDANSASIDLHKKLNFRMVGKLEASGFKGERWVDTILMQRTLGDGRSSLPKTADSNGT